MAQHDYVIANDTAANLRADLNAALAAIVSTNSGATAPATTYANQLWYDTTTNLLKIRSEANDAWVTLLDTGGIPVGALVGTTDTQTLSGKTITNLVLDGSVTEEVFAVTGTTPALSAANGTIQTWTLSANSTPTDSLSAGQSITLMIDDGTAYTITWPSVTWVGGTAPTLATTGYSVVTLWKVSTTLYGSYLGDVA